jgi:hypothetical protein
MTRLVEALQTLGVKGEVGLSGRWVTIEGERCQVQVVEASWGSDYYSWCDDPAERTVRRYTDATAAIRDGLHRATPQEMRSEGPGTSTEAITIRTPRTSVTTEAALAARRKCNGDSKHDGN